ncbi:EF-hand domain-containing protein [Rhizobium oryzicola]|uniref:EF-hand domain-containing protein n=1 Tax=Rhizobium oryzicola TaxID=1232668 RepID=A0ABT8SQY4_9HYPH|nr:hypothetical protein [Rhizobium oryzicola]MDO1580845.1 hypothetical protein [Rhizobium oryzicola]
MNGKKFALAALGATLLMGAAAPASYAAPDRHGPRPGPERAMMMDRMFIYLLKNADANKDGKITKDELVAWEENLFSQIDANKDGSITPGELRAYQKTKMEEWRSKMKEARADAPPPGPDGKGPDGKGPDHKGPHGPRNGMGPDRMGPGHKGPGLMGNRIFRMIDTDENGQISKAEASAAVDKLFTRMDRNKDGVISIDDLPNGPF